MTEILNNPYEGVDWDTVEHHYSQFHLHRRYFGSDPEPADVVDVYTGEGTDTEGNYLPEGDEHTLFGVGDKADSMADQSWPWTEFSTHDSSWEDRDPEQLGAVAVPAAEHVSTEHIVAFFTTRTHDSNYVRNTTIGEIIRDEDQYVPGNGGLCYIAHPLRYTNDQDAGACCGDGGEEIEDGETPDRYLKDFSWWSLEDGLLGVEVFRRTSDAQPLWDRLLCCFLPQRQIWAFAGDDTNDPQVVGQTIGNNTMTVLMPEGTFNPSDQMGSMETAADAYREGRFFAHQREQWDAGVDDPPLYPTITAIGVDGLEITITAEGYDTIEWISKGDVVETGDRIEVKNEHYPYVRASVNTDSGAETLTQPITVEGDAEVAELGDVDLGDVNFGEKR